MVFTFVDKSIYGLIDEDMSKNDINRTHYGSWFHFKQ